MVTLHTTPTDIGVARKRAELIDEISQDMALRTPQKAALLRLDGVLRNITDLGAPLTEIAASVTLREFDRFDTNFPSFCFHIATAVGKTRLMGACIAYLYHSKGWRNYFILTKGNTVYEKTIANFTRGNPKYVLEGYTDLPPMEVITGDNYERADVGNRLQPRLPMGELLNVFIFNVEKLFDNPTERRRFHSFNEMLGGSLAELLAAQGDMVLLMDESHRYRATASMAAANDLRPVLGLEYTATPASSNVIYRYTLGQAIGDSLAHLKDPGKPSGYIKVPVVLGRRDMHLGGDFTPFEEVQLQDGIARHRQKKAQLQVYCANYNLPPLLPIVLISTKDISHANDVRQHIESDDFFNGEYKGKTVLTHSRTGELTDADIQGLLSLEASTNDKEIVIHVNRLREGWDVRNVYTIIPLRASKSDVLTEQTIGRGLRLPYGVQTGDEDLDTLEIAAHEHFAQIVRDAHKGVATQGTPILTKELTQDDTEEKEPRVISPTPDSPYYIEVPLLKPTIQSTAQLHDFPIAPTHAFSNLSPALVATVLGQSEQRTFDVPIYEMSQDPLRYLVQAVFKKCKRISTSDPNDKKLVPELVRRYLQALSRDTATWKGIVQTHAAEIVSDIVGQISANVQQQVDIGWAQTGERIEWHEWSVSVLKSSEPPPYSAVPYNDYKKGMLVDGYRHTIYPQATFDSKQEKWLADILEREASAQAANDGSAQAGAQAAAEGSRTPKIQAWLRVPNRQLQLFYGSGNYNPDLLADDGDTIYLLEVKSASEVTDEVVQQKAATALEWCEAATKAGLGGRKWVYRLIPHDCIDPTDSFMGVLSKAANLPSAPSNPPERQPDNSAE